MFRLQVASAFSHMLNLHNLTEEVSNTKQEHAMRLGEVSIIGMGRDMRLVGVVVAVVVVVGGRGWGGEGEGGEVSNTKQEQAMRLGEVRRVGVGGRGRRL